MGKDRFAMASVSVLPVRQRHPTHTGGGPRRACPGWSERTPRLQVQGTLLARRRPFGGRARCSLLASGRGRWEARGVGAAPCRLCDYFPWGPPPCSGTEPLELLPMWPPREHSRLLASLHLSTLFLSGILSLRFRWRWSRMSDGKSERKRWRWRWRGQEERRDSSTSKEIMRRR